MEVLEKLRCSTNDIINLDMLDWYGNKNERNKIDQDIKQDKKTEYIRDVQNTNNIFDKNKNELNQDHNKSQASVVENNNDPYNDKRWILQYAK